MTFDVGRFPFWEVALTASSRQFELCEVAAREVIAHVSGGEPDFAVELLHWASLPDRGRLGERGTAWCWEERERCFCVGGVESKPAPFKTRRARRFSGYAIGRRYRRSGAARGALPRQGPAPPLQTLEELTTEDAEFTELDDDFDAKLFFAEGLGGFYLGGAVGGHGVGGDPDGYE